MVPRHRLALPAETWQSVRLPNRRREMPMPPQAAARSDDVKLAVAVIVVTVLGLSFGDALIKQASAELGLWQIFVLRSLLALPLLWLVLAVRYPAVSLRPRVPIWTAARSLMLTVMWVAYYAALPHIELSIAAAVYYTAPIFITLFAALFVGEQVGRAGWCAIVLGFCGAALILKPWSGAFNLYALLPLLAAVLYALSMILTRTKCRDEHPLVLSAALNVAFVVAGLLATAGLAILGDPAGAPSFLSAAWVSLGWPEVAALLVLTLAILIGSIGAAVAYQLGPPSVVATFDFAYVGFAALWGLLLFAEVPDRIAVTGIGLIVGAGIIAVRR